MKHDSEDLASKAFAAQREREVGARVRSLFMHCETSKNPVLAYSRACSKVGYLARDGVRSELHYLESALNERKHALLMERYGQPEKAREHTQNCGRDLRAFQRAIRTELGRPREPLPTDELQQRIHQNLNVGQWSRARIDLDELAQRSDVARRLPELDQYSHAWRLDERQFAALQGRIERCNAIALERDRPAGAHPARERAPQPAARSLSERAVVQLSDSRRQAAPGVEPERAYGTTLVLTAHKDRGLDR